MTAHPGIRINGGTLNAPTSIAPGGAVQAILDNTDGVSSNVWTVSRVEPGGEVGDYSLVTSGSVSQQVDTTGLLRGTAGVLKSVINGGQTLGVVDPSTIREVKFYVPTSGGAMVLVPSEVGDAQEPDLVSGLDGGAVEPINAQVLLGGVRGGVAGRSSGTTASPGWDDIGTILVDLREAPATRTINVEALIHSSTGAQATNLRLFNLDADVPAAVTLSAAITSTDTDPELVLVTATEDANLPADRINRLVVQIQVAIAGPTALCDLLRIYLS